MNKKAILAGCCSIALAAVTTSAAPPSVQVSLSVAPAKTLPGNPVSLELRVRNEGPKVELAPDVRVRATSPTGQSFIALWGDRIDVGELEFGLTDEEETAFFLPAKSTVDLSLPAVPLTQNSWAHDQRLISTPGKWTLELLLWDGNRSPITSSPVSLEIVTPDARDVWIWQALERGEFWSIAEKIMLQQPDSPYFPFLATGIARFSTLDKVAILHRAIELHPGSPVVPSLRYAIAEYYGSEADRLFFKEHDLERAVALAEKGRGELARLRNGKDAWSKLKGNQKEGDYPSRAGYLDLQRLRREKGTGKP